MTLELASIPLAFLAGIVGVLSPCVWPLVPVVMSAAATGSRSGPLFLALGLSVSFAVAGTFVTLVLLNLGLDPVGFRYAAAVLLVLVGLFLLIRPLTDWLSGRLSRFTGRLNIGNRNTASAAGQFGVGALLGLVWLPCVGPTLGAAIALASLGQSMRMAFLVMLAFGLGTAATLLLASALSLALLNRWRPGLMSGAKRGKQILGVLLLVLGLLVFSGVDKILEAWAIQFLPDWVTSI